MHVAIKKFFKDLRKLLHPHYLINLLLSASFYILKTVYPFCYLLFPIETTHCELDWREWEITIFVAVVIVFKTKKTGSTTMVAYLSAAFMYCKIGNVILYFAADVRMGAVYVILCLVHLLVFPEPTYGGPENIVYFRGQNLKEDLNRDKRVTWLIAFYAAWSPACVNFAPVFSELSAEYSLENLKFGKLDVSRYPDVAKQFYVNDSSFSKQLPTIALFRNGKEVDRRPLVDNKKLLPFFFTLDNIKAAFDLNNLHLECKNNFLKLKGKKSKPETEVDANESSANELHPKSD